jgi:hypothetical protein
VRRLSKVYGLDVRTRSQWGTQHRAVYFTRLITRPAKVPADTVVGHITVTFDDGKFTGDFDSDMREVERIGWSRFGSGVSYNICVDKLTGMVGIGQNLRAKGTHTINEKHFRDWGFDQNFWARAIAWIGMPGNDLSDKALESFAKVIACMMDTGHVTADPDFLPHSVFTWKDCPTDALRREMPGILSRAKALHRQNKDKRTPRFKG